MRKHKTRQLEVKSMDCHSSHEKNVSQARQCKKKISGIEP
jgi:hypothetical protein